MNLITHQNYVISEHNKYIVGILVSKDYSDLMQIKKVIYGAKQSIGTNLEICQINENFMHKDIKKFVLEIGLGYTDVLRYDDAYNINSHDQNAYKFNKGWNPKFFYIRNSNFIDYCNGVCGFITKSLDKNDAVYQILRKVKDKKLNLKLFT